MINALRFHQGGRSSPAGKPSPKFSSRAFMQKRMLVWGVLIAVAAGTGVFAKTFGQLSCETGVAAKQGASFSIDVKYPRITDKSLSGEVRQKVNDEISRFANDLLERALKQCIGSKAKRGGNAPAAGEGRDVVMIRFNPVHVDKRRIDLKFEKRSQWIGDARGVTEEITFSYDLQAMKVLEITKKVIPDGK